MAWTFVAVRYAIAFYGVLGFLSVRFALAAAALAPYAAHKVSRRTLVVVAGIGLVLPLADYGSALYDTTDSGLITGLFVVFAPIRGLRPYSRLPLLRAAALTAGSSSSPSCLATSGWSSSPGAGRMGRTGAIYNPAVSRSFGSARSAPLPLRPRARHSTGSPSLRCSR